MLLQHKVPLLYGEVYFLNTKNTVRIFVLLKMGLKYNL